MPMMSKLMRNKAKVLVLSLYVYHMTNYFKHQLKFKIIIRGKRGAVFVRHFGKMDKFGNHCDAGKAT